LVAVRADGQAALRRATLRNTPQSDHRKISETKTLSILVN